MRKNLSRQLRQQPRLIPLRQLLKHRINALPLRIPDSTESISRHRARHSTRKIRHNKPHRPSTQATDQTPKFARGLRILALRHALFSQHLLEHASELRVRFLFCPLVRREAEIGPGKAAGGNVIARDFFFVRVVGGGVGKGRARGVVVPPPVGVGERVVGVVYGLELFGARGPLGGVGGDAVRVGFEGSSEGEEREWLA